MNRDESTAINRRLLERLQQRSTDLAADAVQVPAEAYLSKGRFDAEIERLFRNTPQPVAFSAEINGAGSYLATEVLDLPLLLVRSDAGVLNAFINACSHRGAAVARGQGKLQRLVCGFHGWAYSLEGDLVGRPKAACFDVETADCSLSRLPVSERHGLVVVGMHESVSQHDVDTALDGFGEEIGVLELEQYLALERREYRVEANWKLVTELSLESYHFATLHRDSVSAVLESSAVVDTLERHSRWAFPLKSINRLNELDSEDWPAQVEGSVTYTLYPGVMLIVNASGAQLIRAEPGRTVAESRVTYVGVRPASSNEAAARQAYEFGGDVFEKEDLPMAEECQRGISARRNDVVFGRNELLLQFWHRVWNDALGSP